MPAGKPKNGRRGDAACCRSASRKGVDMSRKCVLGMALLVVVFLVSAGMAFGQDVTATITGTVTDSTGAAVAGATVTAKSVERGTTFTGVTNDLGLYRITQLPVGNYDLRIEKSGFQSAVHASFAVTLNQIARVDVELKVGQVTDTVEVTAGAPILKTEATQIDTIINSATLWVASSAQPSNPAPTPFTAMYGNFSGTTSSTPTSGKTKLIQLRRLRATRSVGTCTALLSADLSRKTSCSSLWTIRGSGLTILRQETEFPYSMLPSKAATLARYVRAALMEAAFVCTEPLQASFHKAIR